MDKFRKVRSCIYMITNPKGRIYIGQTVDFRKRYKTYRSMHPTVASQRKLYASFKKYGFESHSFRILHLCRKEQLNELEIRFIEAINTTSKAHLNCQGGGHVPLDQETLRRRSETMRGRKLSQETRDKISQSNAGENNGMHGVTPWNKGRKHRPETIEKCRRNAFRSSHRRGKKHSAETRQLISQKVQGIHKGAKSPSFKGYILAYTVEGKYVGRYEGLLDAEMNLGVNFRLISRVLSGGRKQTKGYVFKRESDGQED